LAAIDIKTGKQTPLLVLPNQRDVQMSLSPDGLALLFDQVVTATKPQRQNMRTNEGEAIATGRLWLLPSCLLHQLRNYSTATRTTTFTRLSSSLATLKEQVSTGKVCRVTLFLRQQLC
jgi:hypothetical protein